MFGRSKSGPTATAAVEDAIPNVDEIVAVKSEEAKLRELQVRLNQLTKRETAVEEELRQHGHGTRNERTELRGRALFEGQGGGGEDCPTTLRAQLRNLRGEIRVVKRAIELQRTIHQEARRAAAAELIDEVKPHARAILERFARAVEEMQGVIRDYDRFQRALRRQDMLAAMMPGVDVDPFPLSANQGLGLRYRQTLAEWGIDLELDG